MKKILEIRFFSVFLLLLGLSLLLFGFFRGEAVSVLQKSIYVCLECVGIG